MWIDQVCAVVDKSGCLHLQFHKAERTVIEDHQLYRQFELAERQQVAEQHRQATIAGKSDDLPPWMAGLDADGLWQSVRHRAMTKGAEQSALAVHMQIARRPDRRRAHVAGKDCVFGRQLIQNLRDVLWMNWGSARFTCSEIVKTLARILV